MSQVAPAFSYAQAAKGPSPTTPIAPSSEKGDAEAMGSTVVSEKSIPDDSPVGLPKELPNGQPLSNGHLAHGPSTRKSLVVTPKKTNDEQIVTELPVADTTSSDLVPDTSASTPPSPDLSSVSTSTLPKEEGVSATPNASSDSTWEKQSQASQVDEKQGEQDAKRHGEQEVEKSSEATSEKGDEGKAGSPSAVWDQLASASQLREAPLPAVNVWQQRALDLKAKAVKSTKPPANPAVTTRPSFQSRSQSGSNSPKDDERNIRGRKDPQGPSPFEHAHGQRASKDLGKFIQNTCDLDQVMQIHLLRLGAFAHQLLGPGNQSLNDSRSPDLKSPSVAPLPPSADTVSWPTPDTAKDEERRRAQDKTDRQEKNEKDKNSTTRSHGKEKWVHVPYVPTAVFSTPLPPTRRGGRQPRGGRGDSRGGHMSHGSIGGERTFSGGQNATANPTTSSPTATTTERGRGEMGPPPIPRGGTVANRGRRPASAGPHFNQEQTKALDSAREEQRSDIPPSTPPKAAFQHPRTDTASSRRTSNATRTENVEGRRQVSPSTFKNPHTAGRRPPQGEMDSETRSQGVPHEHTHPRASASDRKSENTFNQHEGYREPSFTHREGRPERGRGGFRGRGGANGFHGNHFSNGPHANGASVNHSSSGFPSKPHSYTDRQASLPNSTSFNSPRREPGPYRSNSRSHSITSPPPAYNRFSSGSNPNNPQLPALQTQLANMYGYEAGHPGIMTAVPYHPFVDSASQQLFGMVSMQMYVFIQLCI